MSEFIDIIIEGFDDADGDFQEIITRDVIIDLPSELFDGYGTNYGINYGIRL